MNKRRRIFVFIYSLVISSCQFFIPGAIDGDKITFQVKLSDSLILEPDNRLLLRKIDKNAATELLSEIDSVDLRGSEKFFLSNGKVYTLKSIDKDVHEVMHRNDFDIEFEDILNVD